MAMSRLCRVRWVLSCAALLSLGAAPAFADDVDNGIDLRVRATALPGNVAVTWDVGQAARNAGANDFELQLYVGGGTQWLPQFSTSEPTDNGNPAVLSGVPSLYCFRMIATVNGAGAVLGSGTSGNKLPCADPPPDTDGDGVPDADDAFPGDPAEWLDTDGDGTGNNADNDDDDDGLTDGAEISAGTDPLDPDTDGDGDLDGADNCPLIANAGQQDSNGNGVGDACELGIAAGDLLISGAGLYRRRGGSYLLLASNTWGSARGVAVDADGEIYLGGFFGPGAYRLNLGSGSGEQLYAGLPEVLDVGLDNRLYVVEALSASELSVTRINLTTLAQTTLFTFRWDGFGFGVRGITADADGNVYLAGEGIRTPANVLGRVLKYTAATGVVSVLHGGGCQNGDICVAAGIAFTADGSLVVSDWTDDQAVRMDPDTGAVLQSIAVDRAFAVGGGAGRQAYVMTDGIFGNQSSASFVDFQAGTKGANFFTPNQFIDDLAVVLATPVDSDGDGIPDSRDEFADDPAEWRDTDGDGTGDNADADDDNDGLSDVDEVSIHGTSPLLADTDGDGVDDGTEVAAGIDPLNPDEDDDGVPHGQDNCPLLPNAEQANFDGDAQGDVCDADDDNDGVNDGDDAFPFDAAEDADADGDGTGDNADTDDDNDGMPDSYEAGNGFDPRDPSDAGLDLDQDTFTSLQEFLGGSDPNDERSIPQPRPVYVYVEGTVDSVDAALASGPFTVGQTLSTVYVLDRNPALNPDLNPGNATLGQYDLIAFEDLNVNGIAYPMAPAASPLAFGIFDLGGDGLDATASLAAPVIGAWQPQLFIVFLRFGDLFSSDALPAALPQAADAIAPPSALRLSYANGGSAEVTASVDVHRDIRNVPGDYDGDGVANAGDNCPILASAVQTDTDGDGVGNPCDNDDDNDAVADADDAFPNNADEQSDSDGDGVGDNRDAFPDDPTETADHDADGIGNNADPDDDNDGLSDADETNVHGTDPFKVDTDADGLADGAEVDQGLDPLDPDDCPETLCPTGGGVLRVIIQTL